MKKKESALKNFVGVNILLRLTFFESNNYFNYSRLERIILLTGFRKGFGKIDFILTP